MAPRILYVQFTDPAAYPPIEHSSVLLANRGWDVLLLGTGTGSPFSLPIHSRIHAKQLKFVKGGWKQKIQYVFFFFWILFWTWWWKPKWVYASDPLVCPAVWLIYKLTNVRVLYHEHDSPDAEQVKSWFIDLVLKCRKRLGRDAELCVLPQQERMLQFIHATQRTKPTLCIWNCPRLDEITDRVVSREKSDLNIYYHGSINDARLPANLVLAAARFKGAVRLQVVGYETLGSIGYMQDLTGLAAKSGVAGLIEYFGAMPRKDLFRHVRTADVGLSLMPNYLKGINLHHMVGASNKAFDYMAGGLPLLVSDLSDWVTMFVEPGYARACNPDDIDSIEAALRWYIEHPKERRQMGLKCQEKIRQSWNYDMTFAHVLSELERG